MKIWLDNSTLKDHYVNEISDAFPSHEVITDIKQAKDAVIAIMNPQHVTTSYLDQMPNLKFIKLLTAGYNTIDLENVKQRGIEIAYAQDVFSIQIAEDVIAKILTFNRRLPLYYEHMKNQEWKFERIDHELYQQTVGIIGAGSIGREVAIRLKAFGCYIIGYRRTKTEDSNYDELVYDRHGLEELLKRSDYIVLSLPLSDATKHFIGKNEFELMKKEALLINVARGEVIDQNALIHALNHGLIRGASLDVTTPEPLPNENPLWHAKNVFITPHQASASPKMQERLIREVIQTIHAYVTHKPLTNLIKI